MHSVGCHGEQRTPSISGTSLDSTRLQGTVLSAEELSVRKQPQSLTFSAYILVVMCPERMNSVIFFFPTQKDQVAGSKVIAGYAFRLPGSTHNSLLPLPTPARGQEPSLFTLWKLLNFEPLGCYLSLQNIISMCLYDGSIKCNCCLWACPPHLQLWPLQKRGTPWWPRQQNYQL